MSSAADFAQIRLNENLHVRDASTPEYTKKIYYWPHIGASLEPILVSDAEESIPPEDKETVGVFVCVNDNDTDADMIVDKVDPEVVSTNMVGDPELVPLKLRHPRGLPVSLTVDDPSILRLYETVTKNYYPHRSDLSSEAGDILPNAAYKGLNDDDVVFAEGAQPGSTFVRLSGPGGHEDALKVTVLNPKLVPDWNRDQKIDQDDIDVVAATNLWRFWINNDEDSEGEGAPNEYDQPGSANPDAADDEVNTLRDLLDFYPVFLDLKSTLDLLGTDDFTYYLSLGENPNGSEGRFIYTNLSPADSGTYLTDITTAEDVADLELHSFADVNVYVSPHGMPIPVAFLDDISGNDKGVVLIEHASAWNGPLYLRIVDANDNLVLQKELNLSVSSVENMFTHKDLRGEVASLLGSDAEADWQGAVDRFVGTSPTNYPDALTNGKAFIFAHGYNNNLRASRGGNAEMFKRLFWQGSRAKYYAVSWYGYQSQIHLNWIFGETWKCPNYQVNVINAFKTAPAFASYVSSLPESTKIVAAHSLGNMVVSSAIQDHSLSVSKYYMINAAVSSEAYSAIEEPVLTDMIHTDWGDYIPAAYSNLFCYNWYKLFLDDPADSRNKLTWNGRFSAVAAVAYNFWSAGDETFFAHDHNNTPGGWTDWDTPVTGERSWCIQEKRKGRAGLLALGGSYIGGWGFNDYHDGNSAPETIPDSLLKTEPFFRKGDTDAIEDFQDLFDPAETASASDPITHAALLATFVPAKRLGMGGAASPLGFAPDERFEMQGAFNNGGWHDGSNVSAPGAEYWNHGDFKTVAMPYVYRLYEKFAEIGDLGDE